MSGSSPGWASPAAGRPGATPPSAATGAGGASWDRRPVAARPRPCRRGGAAAGSSVALPECGRELRGRLVVVGRLAVGPALQLVACIERFRHAVLPEEHLLGEGDLAAE